MRFSALAATLALALPLLAGCHSDESLQPPAVPSGGELFTRYVAMGNSITAGFQSAGINDSTQRQSYAVLFARQAGAPFVIPDLQGRGCPPPFTNNVTMARVGGASSADCDLRAASPQAPSHVNNVAVPGARVLELLTNFGMPVSAANALTFFFLGGKTQVEAMQAQNPTFVSLWIGNNDVLGALTSLSNPGNPAFITPENAFESQYGEIVDSIAATGASAVLFGVADVAVIPYASLGQIYWCLKTGVCPGIPANPLFPANLQVDISCAPSSVVPTSVGDTTTIPWPIGLAKADSAILVPTGTFTIDCTNDNEVVTPAELAALHGAVAGYNAFIQQEASSHNWAFVDVNANLAALSNLIPPFPDITAALANPADPGPVTFGPLFTLDGVHPSGLAHQYIANAMIAAVNSTYGTSIPVIAIP